MEPVTITYEEYQRDPAAAWGHAEAGRDVVVVNVTGDGRGEIVLGAMRPDEDLS